MITKPLYNQYCKIVMLLICFFIEIFWSHATFAQATAPINTLFNARLKRANAVFTMPTGFRELDSGKDYSCQYNAIMNQMNYTIVNAGNSVRIGFAYVYPLDGWAKELSSKALNQNPDPHYIIVAKNFADTVNHKLIIYKEKYLKKTFNADNGGMYHRNCTKLYEGIYPLSKAVFIHKEESGYFEISYFYKDQPETEIEKLIKDTAGMLRFKDDGASGHNGE